MNIESQWHVSKTVPLALVLAIIIQSMGLGAWGGSMMWRISEVEVTTAKNAVIREQVPSLQIEIRNLKDAIEKLNDELIYLRRQRSDLYGGSSFVEDMK